jgi:hypothetical protein
MIEDKRMCWHGVRVVVYPYCAAKYKNNILAEGNEKELSKLAGKTNEQTVPVNRNFGLYNRLTISEETFMEDFRSVLACGPARQQLQR